MVAKKKVVRHMGMSMTEDEHEKWHKEHRKLTSKEHGQLLKHLGITEEEDREWHKQQESQKEETRESKRESINPFAVGGGFLDYCVKQGWLIREGSKRHEKYYASETGKNELAKFGIKV